MATLTSEYQYLGRSSGIKPQSGSYYYYILLYGKAVPDVVTGYYTVSIQEYIACTINSSFYGYGTDYSGTINGTTVFSRSTYGESRPSAEWETIDFTEGGQRYRRRSLIGEGSVQVDATNGLSRSVSLSTTWKFRVSGAGFTPSNGATGTVTVSAELAAIPRASAVFASDCEIGASTIIVINRSNDSFVHTLSYCMPGESDFKTIVSRTTAGQWGWTVPEDCYNYLSSDSSNMQLTIRCETFSGANSLGYRDTTITVRANQTVCRPDLVVEYSDINAATKAATGDEKKVVLGASNLSVNVEATLKKGANILRIMATCGSKGQVISKTSGSMTFEAVDGNNLSVTAMDSRGFTTEKSFTLDYVRYIPLTVNLSAARESPTADTVKLTISGNFFNGDFGTVKNSVSAKMRWKNEGQAFTGWTDAPTPTVSGNTYSLTATIDSAYTSALDVEVSVSDELTKEKVATARVNRGIPVFDWGKSDFNFNVPVSFSNGALTGTWMNLGIPGINLIARDDLTYKYCSAYIQSTNHIEITSAQSGSIAALLIEKTFSGGDYIFSINGNGTVGMRLIMSYQAAGFEYNKFYDTEYGRPYLKGIGEGGNFQFSVHEDFKIGIIFSRDMTISGLKLQKISPEMVWTPAIEDIQLRYDV